MTYYLNSVFVWRISTGAVKSDDTSASTEVYIVTKDDECFTVTEITGDCSISSATVDATSGLHNLAVKYTPATDIHISEFIVVCRNTGNDTDTFILRGRPSGEKKYIYGSKFVALS